MLGEQKRYPASYSVVQLFVQGQKDHDLQGLMHHKGTEKFWEFDSMLALMNLFESLFDELKFPQSTHSMRDFSSDEKDSKSKGESIVDKGKDAVELQTTKPTFVVKVQYRQNATWQGSIQWVEEGKTRNFRSTLELIRLMDDAVGESDSSESGWE